MDIIFFQKLNGLAGVSGFFDDVIIFFASPFAYLVIFVLGFVFLFPDYFSSKIKEKTLRVGIVVGLLASFFARFVIKEGLVLFHNVPRPFEILEGVNQLILHNGSASFPSGHAVFFFTLSTVLIFYSKKIGIFLFSSSFLIVLARVVAGVHWPSDILVGASVGIIVGLLTYSLLVGFVYFKRFFKLRSDT